VAAIAAGPAGRGYWLASADGGVFTFGDSKFFGSLGKTHLHTPVVGMAAMPKGNGYWIVTAGGGVYAFGHARSFGNLTKMHLRTPVIGVATTPKGDGYWLATAGGGVFSFGAAKFLGSLSSPGASTDLSAIAGAQGGQGYWLLGVNGSVHGFGTATNFGSALASPRVKASSIAPTGDGGGYVLGTTVRPPTPARGAGDAMAVVGAAPKPVRTYLGTFTVTCYDLTGVTASGALAGPDSVAVDPNVIPLGTQLYVDGVGQRTADDTGGAIIGDHVDIWEPSYSQCIDWGVQQRAVYRVGLAP
jgi:3D (Asp-Asp-Asp) domain-containing protein